MTINDVYDVIIAGAGPSGGQCARKLAEMGYKVLLTEKLKNFNANSYSSGGGPLSLIKDFDLPTNVVSTFWDKIQLCSANYQNTWQGSTPLGVVLDFAKLREFLASEAEKNSASIKFHTTYISHKKLEDGSLLVSFLEGDNHIRSSYRTRFLIDATGGDRCVLKSSANDRNKILVTGLEYTLEVPLEAYEKYSKTLSFFFGLKWMPQGYAWIFPAESGALKAGVIRYFSNQTLLKNNKSYQTHLNQLLHDHFKEDFYKIHILDKHGKTVPYSKDFQHSLYHNSSLGIGDSISMVNPLAFEGIRHALFSANAAAKNIDDYLKKGKTLLKYHKDIHSYLGIKWRMCELLMNYVYTKPKEEDYDYLIQTFHSFSAEEILSFGFDYRFKKAIKFAYLYYWLRVSKFLRYFCTNSQKKV